MPLPNPKFPSAVAGAADLLVQANLLASQSAPVLLNSMAASDVSLTVTTGTGSVLPTDNFVITIDSEIIFVASRTGDVCSGLVRGAESTTPASHAAGATVNAFITALSHNQLAAEIVAVEAFLNGGPALPNGTTCTTQSAGDDSTKLATTAYVDGAFAANFGWGGDGSDGAVVFDGTSTVLGFIPSSGVYTINRDLLCTTCVVESGVTVIITQYVIFATVSINNAGNILGVGSNGNNGVSSTGTNAGTAGGGASAEGPLHYPGSGGGTAGGAGHAGGTGAGTLGNSGGLAVSSPNAPAPGGVQGNTGATGGTGGSGASGAGGGAVAGQPGSTPLAAKQTSKTPFNALTGTQVSSAITPYTSFNGNPGGSGGGASGAGDGINTGGGGGSAGGTAAPGGSFGLFSPSITNSGLIQSTGGTGGNGGNGGTPPLGNCGGGGGGGAGCGGNGGMIFLVYLNLVNTGTIQSIGGQPGNPGNPGSGVGSGSAGSVGGSGSQGLNGLVIKLQF